MKIKIKDPIGRLYPLLVCSLLAGACSKSPQGEDESQGERSAIILTAGVKDSALPVRTNAAIPVGASASVWVYKRSQPNVPAAVSAVSPSVAGKKYTAAASGKLTPVDGENIYLEKGDYETVGQKMYETHHGMSKLYEVSCEELDFLNDLAFDCGVTGSRVMGGGFGGCTINLVKEELYSTFIEKAKEEFKKKFNRSPKIYDVVISDGARRLE